MFSRFCVLVCCQPSHLYPNEMRVRTFLRRWPTNSFPVIFRWQFLTLNNKKRMMKSSNYFRWAKQEFMRSWSRIFTPLTPAEYFVYSVHIRHMKNIRLWIWLRKSAWTRCVGLFIFFNGNFPYVQFSYQNRLRWGLELSFIEILFIFCQFSNNWWLFDSNVGFRQTLA